MSSSTKAKKTAAPPISKKQEVAAADVKVAVARATGINPEAIAKQFAELQTRLCGQLATVSTEVAEKIRVRDDLDIAIKDKQTRLTELGLIADEAMTLDEVRGQRLSAENENQAYYDELQQARDREAQEYNYNLARSRKEESDRYQDQLKIRNEQENTRRKQLEEGWAAQTKALRDQEDEVKSLREQVAQFPEQLKSEIAKAESILGNTLKRNYEHEKALTLASCENAKVVLQSQVNSLETDNKRLCEQIANLTKQVDSAFQQVRDISAKAVESASGQQALSALQNSLSMSGQNFQQKR